MSDLIYDLSFPLPDTPEDGLTLVVAMHGYADAGQAVDGVSRHLLGALNHSTLATFDIDALMDYRSRRPPVHIEGTRVYLSEQTGSENGKLTLSEVSDNNGRPFLLLSGPEPDLQWRTFATAVTDLARKFRVQRTVCIYSAPMPVPHTRPLIVTQHGAHIPEPDSFAHFDGVITVPGSAALHLEIEMSGSGIETTGLTAHVPHYISGSEYPRAMAELITGLEKVANVDLPVRALEHAAERIAEQLAEQVDDSPEIAQVVAALEHQYDNELSRIRQRQEDQAELEKLRNNIPSGEEIGREFELYLKSLGEDGTEPGDSSNTAGTNSDDSTSTDSAGDETENEETEGSAAQDEAAPRHAAGDLWSLLHAEATNSPSTEGIESPESSVDSSQTTMPTTSTDSATTEDSDTRSASDAPRYSVDEDTPAESHDPSQALSGNETGQIRSETESNPVPPEATTDDNALSKQDGTSTPASAPHITRKADGNHPSTGGFWGRLWKR